MFALHPKFEGLRTVVSVKAIEEAHLDERVFVSAAHTHDDLPFQYAMIA
jgi:hypothetical protein